MSDTTVIAGGTVIDGSGGEGRQVDVLLERGRIAAIRPWGEFDGIRRAQRIDAEGKTVTPGFVDTHAHADNSPLLTEDDTSKILQGVTTEVNGNCGFSLAPVSPEHREGFQTLVKRIFPSFALEWSTIAGYREAMERNGYVTNFATLIGHNTIRIAAMGDEMRAPSRGELATMERLVDEAVEHGVAGLSSGLIYPPGVFSTPDELSLLTARLPPTAVYASHMRNESRNLMASIAETLSVAQAGGVRCHISHLKFADLHATSQMPDALALLSEHRAQGQRVTQDMYPYTAASTMLTALLPPWMHDGGSPQLLARLSSPSAMERVKADIQDPHAEFENYARAAGWDNIVIAGTASHRYEGESLQSIAAREHLDPVDAVARILVAENLQATMILHVMAEADVRRGLRDAATMIGTDGLPVGGGGKPHPRGYGSFARFLQHYVRDEKLMGLAEAVRRITSLPAEVFGLKDRGRVVEGGIADLVVLDVQEMRDRATFDEPTRAPRGVEEVLVNGVRAVAAGQWTGRRAGEFVKTAH